MITDNGVAVRKVGRVAPSPVSEAEWQARVELAAFYRAVHLFGWSEITSNHITLRCPDNPEHFLINPYGIAYDEITASSLVKVDLDGTILSDTDYPVNRAGFVIHSAVHRVRHDANCVIHTHTVADNAVSAQNHGLLPLNQTNALLFEAVAVHEYEGPAFDLAEQERLQRDLGDKPVMILKNHGMLAAGSTVGEAFLLTFYFQRACEMQIATLSCGGGYELIPPEIARRTAAAFARFRKAEPCLDWEAVKRRLDRTDPGYRQ